MPVFDVSALEAVMPEPEELRTAAKSLLDSATPIHTITETAAQSWGKLQAQGVYVIDGAEVVFSAYRPIQRASQGFADDFGTVDAAANVFADAVADLRTRLAGLRSRAAAFNQKIAGDDEWNKDQDLIAEQDGITNELNTIRSELSGHERTFAQAISDLYGGNEYVEYSENGPGDGQFEHGIPKDALNAGAAAGDVPWAHPVEYDQPWYRDTGDALWSFGKGVWESGVGTVTGLANLVGLGGGDAFVQSWKGVGTLAHDLFIVTGAGLPIMLATGQQQKVKDSADNLLAIGKETIHWNEWQSDPAYALGASAFDLATMIGTAGVGAAAKGGSVAGKASDLAGDLGKAAKAGEAASAGGRLARITEVTGIAKGIPSVEDIKVKISELKPPSIHEIRDAVKENLGRLGIGNGGRQDAPQGRAAAPDADSNVRDVEERKAPDTQARPTGADAPGKPDSDAPGKHGTDAPGRPDDAAGAKPHAPSENGSHAGGGGSDGGANGPGKPDDLPTVKTDAAGQPTEVEFPDGTKISVDYPIETPRNDIIGELGPALESIGKDEAWLRDMVEKGVYKDNEVNGGHEVISPEDLRLLMELRHSIPPLAPDTVMQKVIDGKSLQSLLAGTNLYGHSAGGFISRASDVADLRTPKEVYDALRLDYEDTPYLPNDDNPVYAIQFRAGDDLEDIRIPDARAQDALREQGFDVADSNGRPYPEPHPDLNYDPNKGHGWTGSKVEHSKLIPEYQVQTGTGVPYQHGDVIWEINKSGKRVLAAIFDMNIKRPDGGNGMWRRVSGQGG